MCEICDNRYGGVGLSHGSTYLAGRIIDRNKSERSSIRATGAASELNKSGIVTRELGAEDRLGDVRLEALHESALLYG